MRAWSRARVKSKLGALRPAQVMHKNQKLVEPVSLTSGAESLRDKVRQRRLAMALVTFGISLFGFWLMFDVVGASEWTPLKVAEMGLFGLLFTSSPTYLAGCTYDL